VILYSPKQQASCKQRSSCFSFAFLQQLCDSAIWETFFGPILQERRFELRDRVILFNLLRPFENVSLVVFYGKTFQEATPMNGKAS